MEMDNESERNIEDSSQFYCQYCGECSNSMTELTLHIVAEHEDAEDYHVKDNHVGETEMVQENSSEVVFQFYCQFCGESLNTFKELEEHIDTEHENSYETKVITLNNDASAVYEQGLEEKQIKTEPGDLKSSKKNDSGKTIVHKCQFCAATFVDRDAFEKHVEEGHDEFKSQTVIVVRTEKMSTDVLKIGIKEYLCPICHVTFTKHFEVLRHMINTHEDEIKDSDSKGIVNMFLKCDFCEKLFTCDSELAIHTNRHTKEFAYKCPFCNLETYAEKDAFQHMKRVHKGEKLNKKSILKVKNPNPVAGGTKIYTEKRLDSRTSETGVTKLSPSVTHIMTDSSNIKVLKLCDDLEEESEESVSSGYQPDNIFKCPYCLFNTSNGKSLNSHVKTTHKSTFNSEALLQTDKTSVTQKNPETLRKSRKIEMNNVSFYYQCQFCSHKSTLKANIVSHLNSSFHSEEKKKGLFKDLDISKLKVNNQRVNGTFDGIEKKVNGGVAEVQISGIKVHVQGRQKEKSLDNESPQKRGSIEEKKNCVSSSSEKQMQDTLMKSLELSKNQPFIKLERMKLPVVLPKSDLKNTSQGDKKEKSDETILDLDDNVCPYCNFQSKRASALKFHINFNHKGKAPEILSRKRKHEDEAKHIAKKSKPDAIPASKKKHPDKNNQAKHTVVINVDGTVVVEDSVEAKEMKQEPVEDLPLSENNEFDNSEINMSALERSKGKRNVKVVGGKKDINQQGGNTGNEMDNEMILYVCPYCSHRFKWMKSVKNHVTIAHSAKLFSYEDVEVVIEEYKGSSYVPDIKPSKLEERPFYPKFSQGMKSPRKHVETVHKDEEFNENDISIEKDNEENSELDAQSKTVSSYGCLFCIERFECPASAKKHMKSLHEGKGLNAGNVLVLDRSSLPHTDESGEIRTQNRKRESSSDKNEPAGNVLVLDRSSLPQTDRSGRIKTLNRKGKSSPDKNEPSAKYVNTDADQDSNLNRNNGDAAEFFKCPHCEEIFKFRDDVKEHLREYHGKKADDDREIVVMLHSADADMKPAIDDDADIKPAIDHEKPAIDHERFQCPVCDLQLRWKHSILKHARKHHPKHQITAEMIKPVANKTLVERYFCPYCSRSFKWRNSIPRHVGRKHQAKVHEFKVDDVKTLMVNASDGEGENDEIDDNDSDDDLLKTMKMVSCTKCFKTFGTQTAVEKHNMLEHHEDGEPYHCNICPKSFMSEKLWAEHIEMHENPKQKTFLCDVEGCSERFTEKRGLINHLKKDHIEANPGARLYGSRRDRQVYHCKDCNMELPSRAQYWRHSLEVHNKIAEKLHECKVCYKAFLRPHDLKDHMYVHMSTADLQCPIAKCLFKTKKLKYLAEHISRQHNLKIDSKTLGKEVLSKKQMSEEELRVFPAYTPNKVQQPTGESLPKEQRNIASDLPGSLKNPGNNGDELPEDTTVEPDSQIQMLGASVGAGKDGNSIELTPQIGLKSVIMDAVNRPVVDSDKLTELPPGKRYNCQICKAVFPNHRQLIKHKVAEHIEELEVFRCEQCKKTFFTGYDLNQHNLLAHPTSKDYPCYKCGRCFAAASHLQKHMKHHSEFVQVVGPEDGEVMCDVCGVALRYRASLQQHMIRNHPEQMSCNCQICSGYSQTKARAVRQFKHHCSLCNRYFCTKILYQCHMRATHNTTAKYSCEFCMAVFSKMSQLKAHKHQLHSSAALSEHVGVTDGELASTTNDTHQVIEISNEESTGPKFLPKLSEAGLKAVTKELKVYVDDASAGNKHWKCLLCGACFSKVKYFNMHVRRLHVRSEHQPFRCKLCGAGFARVAEFRKHTRTHSGFRPLTCHICQKSFKQQCHLKEHLYTHGTNRQYKCEICQASFKQRGALLAHVVRHDKIKPFKCHFCGVGFTIRWSLSKHMKKYLEADFPDTHLCHICHQTFQFFPLLLKHIQSHQEPNPWTCEVCNKSFAAYSSFYDHKSKQKHFVETDYETESKPKRKRKSAETVDAVGSLPIQGETVIAPGPTELGEGEMIIDTATEEVTEQPAVEIVIQDQGNGEHTTYKVQGHTDIDILSIAKQLTEMSGSLGQDIYIEEVAKPSNIDRNEEEEKIMMTMLDADEDVRSNLEKTLQQSQKDAHEEEGNSGLDRQYMELVQTMDASDHNVGKSFVVIQGSENAEPEYEVVETESREATEILTEMSGNDDGVEGKSYIIVQGSDAPDSEYGNIVTDSRDQVAAEVLTEFSRSDYEVEGVSNAVLNGNETVIPAYETKLSEPLENAEAVTEVTEHEGDKSENQTELHVNENNKLHSEEIDTINQNQTADEVLTEHQNEIPSDAQNGTTAISDGTNLSKEKLVESSLVALEDPAESSVVVFGDGATTTSEKMETDDGSVVYTMIIDTDNNGAIPDKSETIETTIETTETRLTTDHDLLAIENNVGVESGDNDVKVVVTTIATTGDFGDNAIITTGGEDAISDTQTDQVEYVVINTDSGQVSQAEDTIIDTGLVEMDEPPVLQTDPVRHIQIQSIEQEGGDIKTDMESVEQDQIDTNETSHTLDLIPVNIPEYGSQPMYMFQKADGSHVFISVPEDVEYDNAELISAALEADGYIEEQSNRDHSTLEAAEILKSVAGGSNTILEQVGVSTEMIGNDGQVLELQINEETVTGNYRRATHDLSEAEIESKCIVVSGTDTAEGTVAYRCTICGSVLKSKKNLRYHLRRHAKTEDRAFECSQCHKRFVANSELNRHMRVHTDFRPCECKICGKSFRQPGHLMAHTYTHTGEKPFECRLCEARFTTSTLLKNHMMKHTNLRPFKCTYESCDRSYKTQRELTMHRAVHSGLVGRNKIIKSSCAIKAENSEKIKQQGGPKKRQHICYICGKTYPQKSKLDEHLAIHEDRREFVCDVCGLGFNTKSGMNSHAYSHIDERPEICETCGWACKNKTRLKRHQKVHTKKEGEEQGAERDLQFQCPACGKKMRTRSSIYYHIGSSKKCMSMIKQEQLQEETVTEETARGEIIQEELVQPESTVYLIPGNVADEFEGQI